MQTVDFISKLAPAILAFVVIAIALLAYFRRGRFKFFNMTLDLSPTRLDVEAERIRRRIESVDDEDYSAKQFRLLREYHAQGLAQSKISFWFSLVFASLGFAVIISAVASADKTGALAEQGRTWITFVAGVVIDAVSALFFVQSNKARQLMVEFFDRLRSDRKLEESLSISRDIPDPIVRSRLAAMLSLYLAEAKPSDDVMIRILGMSIASGDAASRNGTGPETPNKAPEPTTTAVTPPAAQESRRP